MPRFTQYTDSTFHPVPGSLSAKAIDIFRTAFHPPSSSSEEEDTKSLSEKDPMNPGVILVLDILNPHKNSISRMNDTFTNIQSPLYNATWNFTLHIQEYILHQLHNTFHRTIHDDDDDDETNIMSIQVLSYYSYQDNHLSTIAQKLVTATGTTTILFITFSIPSEYNQVYKKKRAYINCILDSIQEYGNQYHPPNVQIGYTGLRYFDRDIAQGVYRDLQHMDFVVIPLALFAWTCVFGGTSWIVLIVPILTLVTSVSVWSIIMAWIVQHVQITQITPTVMMSLTLGVGFDYSYVDSFHLFNLSYVVLYV